MADMAKTRSHIMEVASMEPNSAKEIHIPV
jgi:hypothetical protein